MCVGYHIQHEYLECEIPDCPKCQALVEGGIIMACDECDSPGHVDCDAWVLLKDGRTLCLNCAEKLLAKVVETEGTVYGRIYVMNVKERTKLRECLVLIEHEHFRLRDVPGYKGSLLPIVDTLQALADAEPTNMLVNINPKTGLRCERILGQEEADWLVKKLMAYRHQGPKAGVDVVVIGKDKK